MTYDKRGLGIAEMTFISINHPDIWEEMDKAFDDGKDELALDIARKAIEAREQGLLAA